MRVVPSDGTGVWEMYSLMLQVPVTAHSRSSVETSIAIAHASISNIPPHTGVPAGIPVSAAASAVTRPHISADARSGGSASHTSGMP